MLCWQRRSRLRGGSFGELGKGYVRAQDAHNVTSGHCVVRLAQRLFAPRHEERAGGADLYRVHQDPADARLLQRKRIPYRCALLVYFCAAGSRIHKLSLGARRTFGSVGLATVTPKIMRL